MRKYVYRYLSLFLVFLCSAACQAQVPEIQNLYMDKK